MTMHHPALSAAPHSAFGTFDHGIVRQTGDAHGSEADASAKGRLMQASVLAGGQ
jgi:hypothetical protein